MSEIHCEDCEVEIVSCTKCGTKFAHDNEIICSKHGHFCSERCHAEFLANLDDTCTYSYAKDYHINEN